MEQKGSCFDYRPTDNISGYLSDQYTYNYT